MKDLSFLFKKKIANCPLILGDVVVDHTEKLTVAELSIIENISNQEKRNEFSTGRYLLKAGLKRLNFEKDFDILRGSSGAPQLPDNFIASISHTKSYAVACVNRKQEDNNIGIDIEEISRKVSPKIVDRYLFKEELLELPFKDENEKLLRLFSAKEAYFKALTTKVDLDTIKLFYKNNSFFVDQKNKAHVFQEIFDNKFIISICIDN